MRIFNRAGNIFFGNPKISFISDGANWVLDEIAKSLFKVLKEKEFHIVRNARRVSSGIIHYSTIYSLPKILEKYNPKLKYVLTFFHISEDHYPMVQLLAKNQELFHIIHTSCVITKKKLVQFGIDENKIVIIPIGLDLSAFKGSDSISKVEAREELDLPRNSIIIGSFQKDGNGWGEGDEPKLVKGPDILCDVLEQVHQERPVFVLLTGPARGYVKKRLSLANIPFVHRYLDNYRDIHHFYKALDLYLITSRVEGGPRAVLEALALGVPVVSTAVGQVPEVIVHGQNGLIADVEDSDGLTSLCLDLITHDDLKVKFAENGRHSIIRYDYKVIAQEYYHRIYAPLLGD